MIQIDYAGRLADFFVVKPEVGEIISLDDKTFENEIALALVRLLLTDRWHSAGIFTEKLGSKPPSKRGTLCYA
ncbi:hypothetical protein [Okeania sp. KiyG1]|uniref:hypothetical protein n=1 Tax=Okeania sp. KiyG1 TaxID=2720165 RepID=UPI0019229955|nr:hypothetical protein [Okeania sp. KiyG1]GGA52091.1 hypothetical protein CYANOKiyG1_71880 [Okeania sp. KiyG1]